MERPRERRGTPAATPGRSCAGRSRCSPTRCVGRTNRAAPATDAKRSSGKPLGTTGAGLRVSPSTRLWIYGETEVRYGARNMHIRNSASLAARYGSGDKPQDGWRPIADRHESGDARRERTQGVFIRPVGMHYVRPDGRETSRDLVALEPHQIPHAAVGARTGGTRCASVVRRPLWECRGAGRVSKWTPARRHS